MHKAVLFIQSAVPGKSAFPGKFFFPCHTLFNFGARDVKKCFAIKRDIMPGSKQGEAPFGIISRPNYSSKSELTLVLVASKAVNLK